MIWVCLYLWACCIGSCLLGIWHTRPIFPFDIVRAATFPISFPVFFVFFLLKGIRK